MQKSVSRILDGAAAVAMIAASVVVMWMALSARQLARPPVPANAAAASPIESIELEEFIPLTPAELATAGEARVVLVEFSDYECPFCGRHAREVLPVIRREFVDTRRVAYAFRNLPLAQIHPNAMRAAEAAECAGEQGKCWDMRDRLFTNQGALKEPDLFGYSSALGLEPQRFERCMAGTAKPRVETDLALATRLGAVATPTFFVGEIQADGTAKLTRRLRGAVGFEVFKSVIEDLAPTAALN